jgi:altronate hydrolase
MFTADAIGRGYLRPDGKKGVRNKVLVVFTVNCSSHAAQEIAAYFRSRGEDVDVVGQHGCYDNQLNIRRILSYLVHPNVGASLVIGHGCEYTQAERLSAFARTEGGRPSHWIRVQDEGGTVKTIERGREIVSVLLAQLEETPAAPLYVKDLFFGAECGGSDFASGLAGNKLVGDFFDNIVDSGGSCVFEEIAEAVGLRDYLAGRGAGEQAQKEIIDSYDKMVYRCRQLGQFSISPGNFDGGLTTIEEKSMGAVVKSGTRPIQGVLKIAQRPRRKGLWLLDTMQDDFAGPEPAAAADACGLMDLASLGTHFNFLVTGRGHTIGTPIAPTIKITGNPRTYARMAGDIDINAGQLLTGEKNEAGMTGELLQYVIALCNGERTCAERLGHHEGEINGGNQAPDRVVRPEGC